MESAFIVAKMLDDGVLDLVNRCMAKDPDDRFGTVEQLSGAVDRLRTSFTWTAEEAREWWRIHDDGLDPV